MLVKLVPGTGMGMGVVASTYYLGGEKYPCHLCTPQAHPRDDRALDTTYCCGLIRKQVNVQQQYMSMMLCLTEGSSHHRSHHHHHQDASAGSQRAVVVKIGMRVVFGIWLLLCLMIYHERYSSIYHAIKSWPWLQIITTGNKS